MTNNQVKKLSTKEKHDLFDQLKPDTRLWLFLYKHLSDKNIKKFVIDRKSEETIKSTHVLSNQTVKQIIQDRELLKKDIKHANTVTYRKGIASKVSAIVYNLEVWIVNKPDYEYFRCRFKPEFIDMVKGKKNVGAMFRKSFPG